MDQISNYLKLDKQSQNMKDIFTGMIQKYKNDDNLLDAEKLIKELIENQKADQNSKEIKNI